MAELQKSLNKSAQSRLNLCIALPCLLLSFFCFVSNGFASQETFKSAKPIWPMGRDKEMNLFVGFRAEFEKPKAGDAVLQIAGSSIYRIFLNGEFLGHGPARGPHGFYRVDRWILPAERLKASNIIAVEVAGYNVNSFYLLDQPAFLQAEIISSGKVIASTGGQGVNFESIILKHRLQKVQRYSFQRPFIEYFELEPYSDSWKNLKEAKYKAVKCVQVSSKKLISRRVGYPEFKIINPKKVVSTGTFEQGVDVKNLWKDRSLVNIGPQLKGYPEQQLKVIPSIELQKTNTKTNTTINEDYTSKSFGLAKNGFRTLDLGANLTGFVGMEISCRTKSRIYVTFDEILQGGDVNFKRMGCVNAIGIDLEPGEYSFETFEPYTMRYLKIMQLEGNCDFEGVYLREMANDEASGGFDCSDPELVEIFNAAKLTFRQNATDVFMDCPSRERAGWLCDSFFTARVALDLTGNTTIEKNMYENYLLPDKFEFLPDGMLPMCYPSDHYDEVFIPNWAMWFVVQLEEYLARSGDKELVAALEPRVMELLDYFKPFENEDGLLEKLDSWIFVEWSAANGFVQDVSYPSNMLYGQTLAAAGRIFDKPHLLKKAEKLRVTILKQSYNGKFFVDNAIRKDGDLSVTENHSEVCQYFAFFFNIVNPESHPELWGKLRDEFGPGRKKTKAYREVHMANAFVGNYLRLELLNRYGRSKQLKEELAGYFLYMARQTGTLWENIGTNASCNHGFASHVAHCLYRDVLGVEVDPVNKTVQLTLRDVGLESCSGRIPTENGFISIRWTIGRDNVVLNTIVPESYTLTTKNMTGKKLSR